MDKVTEQLYAKCAEYGVHVNMDIFHSTHPCALLPTSSRMTPSKTASNSRKHICLQLSTAKIGASPGVAIAPTRNAYITKLCSKAFRKVADVI